MKYEALITAIADAHQEARQKTLGSVNRHLILRNWLIGAYLVEFEQNGEERAHYGTSLLKQMAADLAKRQITGCSRQMLDRMRLFFRHYPQMAQLISSPAVSNLPASSVSGEKGSPVVSIFSHGLSDQTTQGSPSALAPKDVLLLSWTHIVELVGIDDPWKRAFYENECLKGNWSKRQLQRQIGSLLYERTGLSSEKETVINRAREQASESPQSFTDMIRDPYILEFTGLAEKPSYLEKDLETALLDHLQTFLLELGSGFCFEARQKRISVGNEHDYIDLVFYHRIIRCHLLIDLKTRKFEHGDAGQMNFYLNFWKEQMMEEGDNPPVGLLLCTDKAETKVEYATAGLDQQFFVSRYLVALPKPEELEALIEGDRAFFEEQTSYNSQSVGTRS